MLQQARNALNYLQLLRLSTFEHTPKKLSEFESIKSLNKY